MQLPISISPNPLFISTIEIRFSTNINRLELLQKMSSIIDKLSFFTRTFDKLINQLIVDLTTFIFEFG